MIKAGTEAIMKNAMQKLFKHQGPGLIEITADVNLI